MDIAGIIYSLRFSGAVKDKIWTIGFSFAFIFFNNYNINLSTFRSFSSGRLVYFQLFDDTPPTGLDGGKRPGMEF